MARAPEDSQRRTSTRSCAKAKRARPVKTCTILEGSNKVLLDTVGAYQHSSSQPRAEERRTGYPSYAIRRPVSPLADSKGAMSTRRLGISGASHDQRSVQRSRWTKGARRRLLPRQASRREARRRNSTNLETTTSNRTLGRTFARRSRDTCRPASRSSSRRAPSETTTGRPR